MLKRTYLLFLTIAILLTPFAHLIVAQAFQDIKDYEREQWSMWLDLGMIKGYADNTLRLENPVTMAEFITFINRALELKGNAKLQFKDVPKNAWYAQEIEAAVAAGYLKNDEFLYPNSNLTYQTVTPILYSLYKFEPANKDYLANFDLPQLTDELHSQLNTLVKENVLWEQFITKNEPINRGMALWLINDLVEKKYAGSMLAMLDKEEKEIFSLLKLNPKEYYYYGTYNFNNFITGEGLSFKDNDDYAKKVLSYAMELMQDHKQGDKMPRLPSLWVDRQETHIFIGIETPEKNYVAYKNTISKEDKQLVLGEGEQVLFYDRSEIVAAEEAEIEKHRLLNLEKKLAKYMPIAEQYNLRHEEYYLYAPEQENELYQKRLAPFNNYTDEEYKPILDALVTLHHQKYYAQDMPFVYWVARDGSHICAGLIDALGNYRTYRLSSHDEKQEWQIISLPSFAIEEPSTNYQDNVNYQLSQKLAELGIDESEYHFFLHQVKQSALPVIVNNAKLLDKLEMSRMNIIDLGGIGSSFPPFWIHKSGKEAYSGLRRIRNDKEELLIVKLTPYPDNSGWSKQIISPEYKQMEYQISEDELNIINQLGLDLKEYIYYPYEQREVYAFKQTGPFVNDLWGLGESLNRNIRSAYRINEPYDDTYPAILIKKDGSEAYAIRKTMAGVEEAYRFFTEWYYYERNNEAKAVLVWSRQNILPEKEYEVYVAPENYQNAMEELNLNTNDYLYFPMSNLQELYFRSPSLFGESNIAGMNLAQKGSQLLREHGQSMEDQKLGYYIHPSGDNAYVIQKKADEITYVYKMQLGTTAEGYIKWDSVGTWQLKN